MNNSISSGTLRNLLKSKSMTRMAFDNAMNMVVEMLDSYAEQVESDVFSPEDTLREIETAKRQIKKLHNISSTMSDVFVDE